MIEVELRGKLSDDEYEMLTEKLSTNGKFIKSFSRFNLLYRSKIDKNKIQKEDFATNGRFLDLKCRVTKDDGELVVKIGEPSSADREEIEVKIRKDEFLNAVEFLRALGYYNCLATVRTSERYMYKGIEFTIAKAVPANDFKAKVADNIYYEAEIPAEQNEVEDAKTKIVPVLRELGLTVLVEHEEDIMRFGGDATMKSGLSYYELIAALNSKIDMVLDTRTDEARESIEKVINLL